MDASYPSAQYFYEPAITGETLKQRLLDQEEQAKPLVDGLLYENSIILISADPGLGKSTLIANMIAQMSSGLPVFGGLIVPRPLKCYYIPFERGEHEVLERLKHMEKVIPFTHSNLFIFSNKNCPTPNLLDSRDQDFIMASIEQDCKKPDVVIYDPIYACVNGGLSDETRVSIFTRFNTRLMKYFGCATWLNHHTVKTSYDRDGNAIEKEDPFYGSQFLKAHCTGAYYVKANQRSEGTIFIKKKDSHSNLIDKIPLRYEHETYTSVLDGVSLDASAKDKVLAAIRTFKGLNKPFTFSDLKGCVIGVSNSRLRQLLCTPQIASMLEKSKSPGASTLYTVLDPT